MPGIGRSTFRDVRGGGKAVELSDEAPEDGTAVEVRDDPFDEHVDDSEARRRASAALTAAVSV